MGAMPVALDRHETDDYRPRNTSMPLQSQGHGTQIEPLPGRVT
jgi:hypothetical protein